MRSHRRPLLPALVLAALYLVAGLMVLALLWPSRPSLDRPILPRALPVAATSPEKTP